MEKRKVDLRSDVQTLPTKEMFEAITNAELGDDNSKEDPTVNELEELAAKKLGTEAALLTLSGTMSNQVAIMTHTRRGEEVIVGSQAHLYLYEVAAMAVLSQVQAMPVKTNYGMMAPEDVESAIRPEDIHQPVTSLVCIENTHNVSGGTCLTEGHMKELFDTLEPHGLPVHVDGARIFNASVALKTDPKNLTKHIDSIAFCLSKGLACPLGSLLCGTEEFIARASSNRKTVGGTGRQSGIIAAPGIVALNTMIDRQEEDHRHARILADALNEYDGITVDMKAVQTNLVYINFKDNVGKEYSERLAEEGVLSLGRLNRIRFATHADISPDDIKYSLEVFEKVFG